MRLRWLERFGRLASWAGAAGAAALVACGSSGSSPDYGSGDDGGGSSSGGSSGGSVHDSGSGHDATSGSSSGGTGSSSGGSSSGSSSGGSGSSSGSSSGGPLQMTSAVSIIVEPSDDAKGLITAIQNAKTSVHMEMYLLDNPSIISALIADHKAGKDVKVILNQFFPSGSVTNSGSSGSYDQLKNAGVNVVWAPAGFNSVANGNFDHEKGVFIDANVAWIMTMNADVSSPTANREYLAVDTDPADVAEAEAIFAADFANMAFTPSGKLVVSPINTRADFTALIGMATQTLDIEAEELTDTTIASELAAAADKGVAVRIVLYDASATTFTSMLKSHGVQLVTTSALSMHAKAIVVDGKYAYVGSENFSGGSIGYNRELGVITNNATAVGLVASTTAKDFAGGKAL